jgi:hypothetical protein
MIATSAASRSTSAFLMFSPTVELYPHSTIDATIYLSVEESLPVRTSQLRNMAAKLRGSSL